MSAYCIILNNHAPIIEVDNIKVGFSYFLVLRYEKELMIISWS